MRDVAALAGVGIKTVSRVINNEPGVAPGTIERVTRAAAELDYHPDMVAGNLRRTGSRTRSLGLLLASVENPFDASIHRGVEDVAEQHGVNVLSASTDERPDREQLLAATFRSRRVDGLIVMASGIDQSYLEPEIAVGTPIVVVDRPPVGIDVDSVMAENVGGGRTGTAHLIAHGHRRIAMLGDLARLPTAADRLAGYREAMAAAGLPLDPELTIEDLHDEEAAEAATTRLLELPNPPTAIFSTRNTVTFGAFRALRSRGLHHRIALLGFDDFALADLLDPPVSVIAQDPYEIGRIATERLFARMEYRTIPTERITLPTRLVVRESCRSDHDGRSEC